MSLRIGLLAVAAFATSCSVAPASTISPGPCLRNRVSRAGTPIKL